MLCWFARWNFLRNTCCWRKLSYDFSGKQCTREFSILVPTIPHPLSLTPHSSSCILTEKIVEDFGNNSWRFEEINFSPYSKRIWIRIRIQIRISLKSGIRIRICIKTFWISYTALKYSSVVVFLTFVVGFRLNSFPNGLARLFCDVHLLNSSGILKVLCW